MMNSQGEGSAGTGTSIRLAITVTRYYFPILSIDRFSDHVGPWRALPASPFPVRRIR